MLHQEKLRVPVGRAARRRDFVFDGSVALGAAWKARALLHSDHLDRGEAKAIATAASPGSSRVQGVAHAAGPKRKDG